MREANTGAVAKPVIGRHRTSAYVRNSQTGRKLPRERNALRAAAAFRPRDQFGELNLERLDEKLQQQY